MELGFLIVFMLVFIGLSFLMGLYLKKIISYEDTFGEKVFSLIERPMLKLLGTSEKMNFKDYLISILVSNLVMAIVSFIVLLVASGLRWDTTINTAISFITNTNLQHYRGEDIPVFVQSLVMIFLMFTSAATGISVAFAFIRGISGKFNSLGNFFEDFTKVIVRVLLPISFVVAILLMLGGVPQSLGSETLASTLSGSKQTIMSGPIATFEAIKHIGTNGGGYFGANSAHPFENPTPITNIIEMLSMMVISGGLIASFGLIMKNKKQGIVLFATCLTIFLMLFGMLHFGEIAKGSYLSSLGIQNGMNIEGKEVRFDGILSTLFSTITTTFTTGSVNTSLDSLSHLSVIAAMLGMMLNSIFGGDGVGFLNLITYVILSVFICGLMVGRTPELFSKKVEAKEMKCASIAILVHPTIILIPLAIAAIVSKGTGDYHTLSRMLYEFTSAAANNGSLMEGIRDNTVFYNLLTGITMLIGRYVSMGALLYASYSLMLKPSVGNAEGFKTDNVLFYIILTIIILVIGALTFFPALCLGPIAEYLTSIG
ncbi:potassium-transporting ATPase subunit KdpA [Clostridium cylindrosporum]|uniref:Potassium-transporting ATPase potassium-binding subunit n=1 Tax=Clostridium cylindrosporum DSM 605 TaxID=1121307 RepID=A0A0J8D9W2_CLOCY|nr:potassium-transporting ATPase subunit KdpA [Clostridium cylindrosporum]KMT22845.1 potassium-transporting ATPase A chain KdpA [Clostridium cylindrosporum DSM 605]